MKENIETLNRQAIELSSRGDYEMALACLKRAIEIDKNNSFLWYNLGITYRDFGKAEEAFNAFMTARNIKPEDPEIAESLAQLTYSLGASTDALGFCMEGLADNEDNPRLWNLCGVIHFNIGNYEDAALAFEQALIFSPYYYDALYNLKDTYEELGNQTGIRECLKKMEQIKPAKKRKGVKNAR